VKKEEPYKINELIKSPVVRVVGDNVLQPGIYNIKEALNIAENLSLDLVEISPTANPPVCKVVDYKKFLYELKKKQKEIKAKTARIIVKEIRLGPNTDDHDFNFKLNHAIKFLKDGAKVKVDVFFKGRSIIYKEQGELILLKFAQSIVDYGKIEQMPRLEGKRMIMIITPKK
jgi:translation initiation factor IF-3